MSVGGQGGQAHPPSPQQTTHLCSELAAGAGTAGPSRRPSHLQLNRSPTEAQVGSSLWAASGCPAPGLLNPGGGLKHRRYWAQGRDASSPTNGEKKPQKVKPLGSGSAIVTRLLKIIFKKKNQYTIQPIQSQRELAKYFTPRAFTHTSSLPWVRPSPTSRLHYFLLWTQRNLYVPVVAPCSQPSVTRVSLPPDRDLHGRSLGLRQTSGPVLCLARDTEHLCRGFVHVQVYSHTDGI